MARAVSRTIGEGAEEEDGRISSRGLKGAFLHVPGVQVRHREGLATCPRSNRVLSTVEGRPEEGKKGRRTEHPLRHGEEAQYVQCCSKVLSRLLGLAPGYSSGRGEQGCGQLVAVLHSRLNSARCTLTAVARLWTTRHSLQITITRLCELVSRPPTSPSPSPASSALPQFLLDAKQQESYEQQCRALPNPSSSSGHPAWTSAATFLRRAIRATRRAPPTMRPRRSTL